MVKESEMKPIFSPVKPDKDGKIETEFTLNLTENGEIVSIRRKVLKGEIVKEKKVKWNGFQELY